MLINDNYLINNSLEYEDKLYLHKDTIKLLKKIKSILDSNNTYSFRTKEVSKEIKKRLDMHITR